MLKFKEECSARETTLVQGASYFILVKCAFIVLMELVRLVGETAIK